MSTDAPTVSSVADDVPAPASAPPPTERETIPPILQTVLWALAACVLTMVNRFIGLVVPLDKFPLWEQHVIACVYFAALLYTLMRLTRAAALIQASSPTLLLTGVLFAAPMGTVLLLGSRGLNAPDWLYLTANNLFLPIGAALVGTAVGRIIKHPNTLLAAAGFSIFFDIVMVTMGTVAALSSTGSQIISMVSVGAGTALPQHAHKTWSIISGVTIGPADILFLSVFFASVFLLRLETKATFRWVYALLLAALIQVEWIGLPVPALAPMGIAVIIANRRHAAFTERERRDLFIGAAFAIACAGLIVWRAQQYAATVRAKALEERKKHIGFTEGVLPTNGLHVITEVQPGSRAMDAGLRAGDVLQKINGIPVAVLARDKEKYAATLQGAAKNGITLTIKSGDQPAPRDLIFPPAESGKPDPSPLPGTTPAP